MCFDRPVTVVALKRLGAGVLAVVPSQLVAPGESPLAALPRALVRLLTWGTTQNTQAPVSFLNTPITTQHYRLLCGHEKHRWQWICAIMHSLAYFFSYR